MKKSMFALLIVVLSLLLIGIVNAEEWIKVKNLQKGDKLFNGTEWIEIKSIKKIQKSTPVFNMHVSGFENYFAEDVLVHNKGEDILTGESIIIEEKLLEKGFILEGYDIENNIIYLKNSETGERRILKNPGNIDITLELLYLKKIHWGGIGEIRKLAIDMFSEGGDWKLLYVEDKIVIFQNLETGVKRAIFYNKQKRKFVKIGGDVEFYDKDKKNLIVRVQREGNEVVFKKVDIEKVRTRYNAPFQSELKNDAWFWDFRTEEIVKFDKDSGKLIRFEKYNPENPKESFIEFISDTLTVRNGKGNDMQEYSSRVIILNHNGKYKIYSPGRIVPIENPINARDFFGSGWYNSETGKVAYNTGTTKDTLNIRITDAEFVSDSHRETIVVFRDENGKPMYMNTYTDNNPRTYKYGYESSGTLREGRTDKPDIQLSSTLVNLKKGKVLNYNPRTNDVSVHDIIFHVPEEGCIDGGDARVFYKGIMGRGGTTWKYAYVDSDLSVFKSIDPLPENYNRGIYNPSQHPSHGTEFIDSQGNRRIWNGHDFDIYFGRSQRLLIYETNPNSLIRRITYTDPNLNAIKQKQLNLLDEIELSNDLVISRKLRAKAKEYLEKGYFIEEILRKRTKVNGGEVINLDEIRMSFVDENGFKNKISIYCDRKKTARVVNSHNRFNGWVKAVDSPEKINSLMKPRKIGSTGHEIEGTGGELIEKGYRYLKGNEMIEDPNGKIIGARIVREGEDTWRAILVTNENEYKGINFVKKTVEPDVPNLRLRDVSEDALAGQMNKNVFTVDEMKKLTKSEIDEIWENGENIILEVFDDDGGLIHKIKPQRINLRGEDADLRIGYKETDEGMALFWIEKYSNGVKKAYPIERQFVELTRIDLDAEPGERMIPILYDPSNVERVGAGIEIYLEDGFFMRLKKLNKNREETFIGKYDYTHEDFEFISSDFGESAFDSKFMPLLRKNPLPRKVSMKYGGGKSEVIVAENSWVKLGLDPLDILRKELASEKDIHWDIGSAKSVQRLNTGELSSLVEVCYNPLTNEIFSAIAEPKGRGSIGIVRYFRDPNKETLVYYLNIEQIYDDAGGVFINNLEGVLTLEKLGQDAPQKYRLNSDLKTEFLDKQKRLLLKVSKKEGTGVFNKADYDAKYYPIDVLTEYHALYKGERGEQYVYVISQGTSYPASDYFPGRLTDISDSSIYADWKGERYKLSPEYELKREQNLYELAYLKAILNANNRNIGDNYYFDLFFKSSYHDSTEVMEYHPSSQEIKTYRKGWLDLDKTIYGDSVYIPGRTREISISKTPKIYMGNLRRLFGMSGDSLEGHWKTTGKRVMISGKIVFDEANIETIRDLPRNLQIEELWDLYSIEIHYLKNIRVPVLFESEKAYSKYFYDPLSDIIFFPNEPKIRVKLEDGSVILRELNLNDPLERLMYQWHIQGCLEETFHSLQFIIGGKSNPQLTTVCPWMEDYITWLIMDTSKTKLEKQDILKQTHESDVLAWLLFQGEHDIIDETFVNRYPLGRRNFLKFYNDVIVPLYDVPPVKLDN